MSITFTCSEALDRKAYKDFLREAKEDSGYVSTEFLDSLVGYRWGVFLDEATGLRMPVVIKKKFGLEWVVQPLLFQQTKIIGLHSLSENIKDAFVKALFAKFPVLSVAIKGEIGLKGSAQKTNYFLPKSSPEATFRTFKKRRREQIRQYAETLEVRITNFQEALPFLQAHDPSKNYEDAVRKAYFSRLCALEDAGIMRWYAARLEDRLIHIAGMADTAERMYMFCNAADSEYRKYQSSSVVLWKIMQECLPHKIFDFEGSSIEGIRRYFSGFNPECEIYTQYQASPFQALKLYAENKLSSIFTV